MNERKERREKPVPSLFLFLVFAVIGAGRSRILLVSFLCTTDDQNCPRVCACDIVRHCLLFPDGVSPYSLLNFIQPTNHNRCRRLVGSFRASTAQRTNLPALLPASILMVCCSGTTRRYPRVCVGLCVSIEVCLLVFLLSFLLSFLLVFLLVFLLLFSFLAAAVHARILKFRWDKK